MIGRRSAAWLCVLLTHALVVYCLLVSFDARIPRPETPLDWGEEPITWIEPAQEMPAEAPAEPPNAPAAALVARRAPKPASAAAAPPTAAESGGATTDSSKVDWPLEAKRAAEREVARELDAERVAKMFSGPQGTWASLTKRQRSQFNKFRWRPGVLGMEYDNKGNEIYHLSDGCVIVNGGVIACALGKVKIHGDMFENMREFFDEQRLLETNEGNGTEPEALRPAK